MIDSIVAAVLSSAITQTASIGDAQTTIAEQTSALDKSGGSYIEFLATPTLSCGIYRLKKGATDGQSPHRLDEVYSVTSGKAQLEIAGKRYPAQAGSVLFVPAGVEHRFIEIEQDLTTLVMFSLATPTTGGMVAGPVPTEQTPYPETSARGSTRIFYWYGPNSAGQVQIDYGRPQYQPAYSKFLTEPGGPRWRFGQDFWTRLDSNIDLTIGGVTLPAGYYYLVLENTKEHGVRLIALDPAEVRKQRLDAYEAPKTTGGIAIPLEAGHTKQPSERLAIELLVDRTKKDEGLLEVVFGLHRFWAKVTLHPAR